MTAALEYTYRTRAGSLSRRAGDDVARADDSLRRREQPFVFRSLKRALLFFFESREKLAAPMSPRVSIDDVVRVDGGRGSRLDDAMLTMATIDRALTRLEAISSDDGGGPWASKLIRLRYGLGPERARKPDEKVIGQGMPIEAMAELLKKSEHTISVHLGRAEGILTGLLHAGEVLG